MSSPHGSSGTATASSPPVLHQAVDAEFGAITGAVVEHHDRVDSDDTSDLPDCSAPAATPCAGSPDRVLHARQWQRLRRRLWHRRWLRQYFREEGVLVREPGLRKIGNEELYLDLIIVANIAALGQDLKNSFKGWHEVETFLLLFGAVYTSWRNIAFLWNMFGTKGDLLDKLGVYSAHAAMSGIGLGSHVAFTAARKHVAVSAFLASAIPIFSHVAFAVMEPDTTNEHNIFDQIIGMQVLAFVGIIPYFCATFVTSERAARALYWIPLIWTIFAVRSCLSSHSYSPLPRPPFLDVTGCARGETVLPRQLSGSNDYTLLFFATSNPPYSMLHTRCALFRDSVSSCRFTTLCIASCTRTGPRRAERP
jgi:hypothetical protein